MAGHRTRTHHLEWKVMPPVKAGDNNLSSVFVLAYSVGAGFILGRQQERCQREREREQEYAYTVHERDPRKLKSFLGWNAVAP